MIRLFETLLPSMLGVAFEPILLLVTNIGILVFAAKDVRIAFIVGMVMNAGLFWWFYEASLNYVVPLILIFIYLILMAFSIYAIRSTPTRGFI